MNLYRSCPHCQHEAHSIDFADNRVDLAMSKGEQIEYGCPKCGQTHRFSVDELYRKPSKWIVGISLIIFLIGISISLKIMSYNPNASLYANSSLLALAAIPGVIYLILRKGDQKRVSRFNEHYFKMK